MLSSRPTVSLPARPGTAGSAPASSSSEGNSLLKGSDWTALQAGKQASKQGWMQASKQSRQNVERGGLSQHLASGASRGHGRQGWCCAGDVTIHMHAYTSTAACHIAALLAGVPLGSEVTCVTLALIPSPYYLA